MKLGHRPNAILPPVWRRARRWVLLGALSGALIAAALAAAEPADRIATASISEPLESAARSDAPARIRRPRTPPAFPVRGSVGYGEADAQFGAWRGGRAHEGQDIFADAGTRLVSITDGRVVGKGDDGGRGNYVAIHDPVAGRTFVYLHMLRPSPLRLREDARAGQPVGAVGCTGSCWGDHLHLEMRRGRGTGGRPLDPLPLLRRLGSR
jgi:murein DD-endopeptidase MepM/ murein hydrolase activator NlpD